MQGNLTRIINRNFVLVVEPVEPVKSALRLECAVGSYDFFAGCDFVVSAHSYLVSENVNVTLHQWNRFGQNVKAGSD